MPRLARWPVGLTAAAVTVVHLVAGSLGRGYWFDEALMLAIGRHHLDWGSADQPPLAPVIAGLADLVAPGSMPVLRLVPSVATGLAVLVAALIARELGGDRRAQTLTALAQATAVFTTLAGHWLTPYTLEPVQWLVLVWLLVRWIRVREDRWLLALGPVLGVAALTKFQVILFGVVLVLMVLVAGPRELLRRPALWGAALIGALIAAPTLVWQAVHGWPQLRMASVLSAEAQALYGGRPGIAGALVIMAGVLGTVLVFVGLVVVWTDPRLRVYRFLGLTFLVLFGFFVATAGRPYYLDGLYGALAAVGAVALQHRREAGHRRLSWVAWPGAVLAVVVALVTLSVSQSLSRPETPDRVTGQVQQVYAGLSPQQRDRTVVYGASYIWAAFVDTADPALGLPEAHSGNRAYGYFDPPPDDHDVVIYVGAEPGKLAPVMTGLRRVGGTDDAPIWLGEGLDRPWSQAWPELRSLTVG
ncbi:glycosyltransferase family 39 protein [Pseudonocardia parietis]|uniref:4-amino-4-deoxy-L-arabinose transferase-like glycosyltransferase n=1 Tax=Pseudonocardia parietis TaxID=570936 RepID=A0ABS4VR71_9PSEU|nr:glycosyltransferase family 39 protein [Pseudonocardia parietis]MBP2366417.1 4-amino-4-deoxy-L-arabinose transferase-like glycosyltransferase [Pseudonocardia parietis]